MASPSEMLVFHEIPSLKSHLRRLQSHGLRVGFVPTMGALHEGHLALVREARARADIAVASIFVNPKQFGPGEDLARYPRDLAGDRARLEQAGCHVLFAPAASMMYPEGFETEVAVRSTSRGLCGDARPGHFTGVATVVLKLLSIARPDVAVFGEKDLQQLAVIRAMARDLSLDAEITGAPIVREPDGLAMSSRNAYLSPEERARALSISRGLFAAGAAHRAGEEDREALLGIAHRSLEEAGLTPEYLELRRFPDLVPVKTAREPAAILTAARVGSTRLIDNLILRRA